MNIRKWVYLFWTTLLLGGGIGMFVGVGLNWGMLTSEGGLNFLVGVLEFFGIGCMFSVFSQMGYFAYLTVHRLGLGVFGSISLWNAVLAVVTIFVLFDLFFLRQAAFREPGESLLRFFFMPLLLLVIGWIVAYLKKKDTNARAFMPTLFFMVVVTIAEWYYPLKENNPTVVWQVFSVLIVCNAWQVLILHRLIQAPKKN